ncbi:hypothetical protein BC826DRAFT_967512 [Russula brevipes]|nr:hypothetical protein BC826DRAFT_967512 [Russula brevipes]
MPHGTPPRTASLSAHPIQMNDFLQRMTPRSVLPLPHILDFYLLVNRLRAVIHRCEGPRHVQCHDESATQKGLSMLGGGGICAAQRRTSDSKGERLLETCKWPWLERMVRDGADDSRVGEMLDSGRSFESVVSSNTKMRLANQKADRVVPACRHRSSQLGDSQDWDPARRATPDMVLFNEPG